MRVKFKEIEFKYTADDMKLEDFIAFCEERQPKKQVIASGYDHFYETPQGSESFCRLRVGPDMNQLTFKRKTSESNNYVRTEHNLDIARKMTRAQVEALCAEFGYTYNTSIFKNCFVYTYDDHVLVYYICYDVNLNELGRFFEIEAREDYAWKTETEARDTIAALERICKPLGVSPQGRIKRSLFEMFRTAK